MWILSFQRRSKYQNSYVTGTSHLQAWRFSLTFNNYDPFLCVNIAFQLADEFKSFQRGVRYRHNPSSLTTSLCHVIDNKTRKRNVLGAALTLHLEIATSQRRLLPRENFFCLQSEETD